MAAPARLWWKRFRGYPTPSSSRCMHLSWRLMLMRWNLLLNQQVMETTGSLGTREYSCLTPPNTGFSPVTWPMSWQLLEFTDSSLTTRWSTRGLGRLKSNKLSGPCTRLWRLSIRSSTTALGATRRWAGPSEGGSPDTPSDLGQTLPASTPATNGLAVSGNQPKAWHRPLAPGFRPFQSSEQPSLTGCSRRSHAPAITWTQAQQPSGSHHFPL